MHITDNSYSHSGCHYSKGNKIYVKRSRIAVFILILLLLPMLTGCRKKQEIVLSLEAENPNRTQGMEGTDSIQEADQANAAREEGESLRSADSMQTAEDDLEPASIYVHICGAVLNPGVYELPSGSRVFAGIEAAGGLLETAYGDYVNQAETLRDGQQLVIPTAEEIEAAKEDGTYEQLWAKNMSAEGRTEAGNEAAGAGTIYGTGNEGKININTATESELQKITGIGATRAAAIVQYRNEHGGFGSIEDIMQVSGIKEGTYEKIKDEITVG